MLLRHHDQRTASKTPDDYYTEGIRIYHSWILRTASPLDICSGTEYQPQSQGIVSIVNVHVLQQVHHTLYQPSSMMAIIVTLEILVGIAL